MNDVFITPVVNSTRSVFASLAGCKIEPGPATSDVFAPPHDLCGMVGMSGSTSAMVLVHLNQQTALEVTGAMLGEKPLEVNSEVIDVVGELTNMIAGGAKAKLAPMFAVLSLPVVVVGSQARVGLVSRSRHVCVPFETPWGGMTVEFSVEA